MKLPTVVHGDITKIAVDAIVNAANEYMLGGGGVDGAIHAAAGPGLKEACRSVPEVRPGIRCPVGEARITPAFALPAKHVIHTVGPRWKGGVWREAELLRSCYRACLALAADHQVQTISFPSISTGAFAYPADAAAFIAALACCEHLLLGKPPTEILLVGFQRADVVTLTKAVQAASGQAKR